MRTRSASASKNPNTTTAGTAPSGAHDNTLSSSSSHNNNNSNLNPNDNTKMDSNTNTKNDKTSAKNHVNTNNPKGNLHSLLKAYDQTMNNSMNDPSTASIDNNTRIIEGNDSISLQLDTMGRDRSSTLGSIRERGLTFGSEFDLGLGLTNENVAQDAVFDLSAVNNDGSGSHGNNVSGRQTRLGSHGNLVSSAGTSNGSAGVGGSGDSGAAMTIETHNITTGQSNQQQIQHINQLQHQMNMNISNHHNSNQNQHASSLQLGFTTQQSEQQQQQQQNDNSSISAGFLNRMFSSNQGQGQAQGQAHTPPSAVATSYEIKHFGKRLRSGTLSGRLRSMSDLEDRGLIDSNQKGILKDLIISGDDELMVAVEKYEKGDTKALEAIIKSGALRKRNASDIDILGDLDLDFLSMNEDFVLGGDESVVSGSGNGTKSLPIPIRTRRRSLSENSNLFMQSHQSHGGDSDIDANTSMRGPSPASVHQGGSYDGIGDLDFNADYPSQGGGNHNTETTNYQTKIRADSILDLQRNRANSLAFGSLLDESNHEAVDSVGKWMDRAPMMQEMRKMPLKKRVSSQIVVANGQSYIINNGTPTTTKKGRKKVTQAEIKRREREERKAMKERAKLEKKAQKELEKQLKKVAKEKKKAAIKKKKTAEHEESPKKKATEQQEAENNEEPKIIVSGTGRPRSLSDPNLSIRLDENGLMQIDHPPDWVGAYSPDSRKIRIERFLAKRHHRVWVKKVKYDVRKNFADSRLRVKGRFVKKEDELLMRDLMSLT